MFFWSGKEEILSAANNQLSNTIFFFLILLTFRMSGNASEKQQRNQKGFSVSAASIDDTHHSTASAHELICMYASMSDRDPDPRHREPCMQMCLVCPAAGSSRLNKHVHKHHR